MSASVVSGRWSGGLVLSLLVVLLVAPSPAPAKSFDFLQIVSSLADNVITRLYREDEIELLGHYCTISRTPYFYKWELNFRATSRCPDWTTALGKAEGYVNPHNAETEATKDLVRKLVERGLVTQEEASPWL
ncbi:anti-lipopolysaccharide factor [Cherax quadricarinatus]|nr:anti-lipopolysaccharide factor-like [Cherax quadricarinatus]